MNAPWTNDRIRHLYQRPEIKASLEVIFSVFTIVFLTAFAIRPTLGTVAELQKKLEDQELVDRKMTTKINQLSKAQSDLSRFAASLPLLDEAIPSDNLLSDVEKRVEVIAQEAGVAMTTITYDAVPLIGENIKLTTSKQKGAQKPGVETGTTISYFQIGFDISGNQEQIAKFVKSLERMDRILILSGVEIQKEEGKNLKATGKAFGYYLGSSK